METQIIEKDKVIETLREKVQKLTEELKQTNATRDKLFSIIGHDLRGPMGNLTLLIETLLESFDKREKKEIKELLDLILKSSSATSHLLDNLLYWAKSNLNQLKINPAQNKICGVLHETCNFIDSFYKEKRILLKFNCDIPVTAVFDEDTIKIVVRNLMMNAMKYTDEKGKVELIVNDKEKHVEISVKDNGRGISGEHLANIFDSGQNFSTAGISGEKGTGLGLLLCKEFIELNRGKLWAESEPGKGSSFTFTLPKAGD